MTRNEIITLLVDTGTDITVFKEGKVKSEQILNRGKQKGVTDGIVYSIATTNTADPGQLGSKPHGSRSEK